MTTIKSITSTLWLFLLFPPNVAMAHYVPAPEHARTAMCPAAEMLAIRQQWSEWTVAYAAHDLEKTMEIFDPDVIFSFQGAADQNYSDLARGYKNEFAKPDSKLEWVPQFEEFECSGDLGFVRSTWVLRRTDPSGKVKELEKNRGVDLFRRHSGGHWKIFRSLNYPFQPPSK